MKLIHASLIIALTWGIALTSCLPSPRVSLLKKHAIHQLELLANEPYHGSKEARDLEIRFWDGYLAALDNVEGKK